MKRLATALQVITGKIHGLGFVSMLIRQVSKGLKVKLDFEVMPIVSQSE